MPTFTFNLETPTLECRAEEHLPAFSPVHGRGRILGGEGEPRLAAAGADHQHVRARRGEPRHLSHKQRLGLLQGLTKDNPNVYYMNPGTT